ncbi:MAG TPA: cyclic nucleotide-binding domain-containing protein [Candidatus Sulfomarinibacteraceae bacterium]|nr:cyclic nucleotide-binding domain-containing protein [Candidatus Sulfomarinibacteraceae bacterium]
MKGRKYDFLDTLPIFTYLTEEELEAVALISTEYEFDEDAVIAYQRDVADKFYMVRSGRLYARGVDEMGIVRESAAYGEGDYFKDIWLFAPLTHTATIRATDAGRLLVIERDDFVHFLDTHPGALGHLAPEYDPEGQHVAGLSPEAWEEARKSRVAGSQPSFRARDLPADALVEYATRRSRWLLFLKLFPLIFALVVGLFGYGYMSMTSSFLSGPLFTVGIPLALVIVFGAVILLQWIDWRNDYFVITTGHIIHYEFNLSLSKFGTVVMRTPVDQVQSVEIERPNFLANLLNVGTVRVTTAAQSAVIYFDYIDDPHAVHQTLTRLQQRVRELDAGREQALMRQSLESHFQASASYKEVVDDEESSLPPRPQGLWERIKENYGGRVVDGEVVTYRKHFIVLLFQLRWPMLVGSVLILLGAFMLYVGTDLMILWILLLLLILVDFGWLIWQGEDWRNDTFQVTSRYVVDIDRSPFGTGESRKQAELSNVQNINADRPGLLPTLFNYGNVYIETAGASADITFENVANPNQVQRDIFDHREAFRARQRVREGAQRRKEYAVLLDVYKQAVEQERIPRRTPPRDIDGQVDAGVTE